MPTHCRASESSRRAPRAALARCGPSRAAARAADGGDRPRPRPRADAPDRVRGSSVAPLGRRRPGSLPSRTRERAPRGVEGCVGGRGLLTRGEHRRAEHSGLAAVGGGGEAVAAGWLLLPTGTRAGALTRTFPRKGRHGLVAWRLACLLSEVRGPCFKRGRRVPFATWSRMGRMAALPQPLSEVWAPSPSGQQS
jgi:hypothetical protein